MLDAGTCLCEFTDVSLGKNYRLYQVVAEVLKKKIDDKNWIELPSYRDLCDQLEVSQFTLKAALELLTEQGLLLPAVPRQRRQVSSSRGQRRHTNKHRKRHLLIVVPRSWFNVGNVAMEILTVLSEQLVRAGWVVEHRASPKLASKAPERILNHLRNEFPHSSWLIVQGTSKIIHWAEKKIEDCILLGGANVGSQLPCVCDNLGESIDQALGYCVERGHQRVCFPLLKHAWFNLEDEVDHWRMIFGQHNLPFSANYNIPAVVGSEPEHIWQCLESLFKYSPPSALIVNRSGHLLTAHSFIANLPLGQSQVEIIDLSGFEHHHWLRPQPAYFEYPSEQYVSIIHKWLRQKPSKRLRGQTVLRLLLRTGECVD